jgi:peptidoglycan hydrolase-like protein with peptidoglycan-binding domain
MRKGNTGYVLGIFMVLLCMLPLATSALSVDDVQAKIHALLKQVSEIQAQIKAIQSGQSGSALGGTQSAEFVVTGSSVRTQPVCALLKRNLGVGTRGDDVSGLQEFLQSEGYLTAKATGYFGPLTASAVAKWQAAEGVANVGTVGPLTRERILKRCGGGVVSNSVRFVATPDRGEAPLTVSFETWLSGFRAPNTYYVIDFGDGASERAADCIAPADSCISPGQNKYMYAQDGVYTAVLSKITDPCMGQTACKAAIQKESVAKQQIHVGTVSCTKEYAPVCGAKQIQCITTPCNPIATTYSNSCMMKADGATKLYEGQCRGTTENPENNPKCKSWNDGCNTCSRSSPGGLAMCTLMYCEVPGKAYCSEYFDSNVNPNKPPVVSGFSGPTTLVVSATGIWTVYAKDPEGGQLSYQITWGDETSVPTAAASLQGAKEFVQTTAFSHAYTSAGTYTVTILVRDSGGQEAKMASTVKVGGEPVACTMQYDPVCGRPTGCMNTCPAGMFCAMMCQQYPEKTYGNRCQLDAAGADFLYPGQCPSGN